MDLESAKKSLRHVSLASRNEAVDAEDVFDDQLKR